MISLDLRSKAHGRTQVLGPMRIEVAPGEVLGISGPSGIGKSTLLRIVAGLDTRFDGRLDAPAERAMVFQSPTLLPWRSVLDNITIPTQCRPEAARAMLARVGLAGHEAAWPGQLSLGQARRVALARAFVGTPRVLLMDEPFSSLDADRISDLLTLTQDLIAQHRPAVILASHSAAELDALATRRAHLSGRPAHLDYLETRLRAGS
jgi:NitT/TauT family transport system ATP-binding protein